MQVYINQLLSLTMSHAGCMLYICIYIVKVESAHSDTSVSKFKSVGVHTPLNHILSNHAAMQPNASTMQSTAGEKLKLD